MREREMSDKGTRKFVSGVAIGAAIGAVTGLLFAPRSGRETRQRLQKSIDSLPDRVEALSESLQLQTRRLSKESRDRWQDTLERLQEAVVAGVEAARQERLRDRPKKKRLRFDETESDIRRSESIKNPPSQL